MTSLDANLTPWQAHEDHVASLYRRLGFIVTQNINVDGQQVDIVCEKWVAGIGRTRLCIDCKHTRLSENRSVSKDDVDQFYFTFRNRADANGWTAAVMVSNRPFSQFARAAAARHPNLHLKTIDNLHEEVLNLRAYLFDSVRNYEDSNRFFDFIPPYGVNSMNPQVGTTNQILLQSIIQDWLLRDGEPQLCLFGDFGTGKTTFLEYLHFTLAKQYLEDGTCRVPLLIPLRKYYEAADHNEIIRSFFALDLQTSLQQSLFEEFLQKGRLLLLLDGFDEMGARSDPTTRKANFLKLAPLAEEGSKIIISCRPAYFLSSEETHSVFSFVSRQIGFAPPVKAGNVSEHLFRSVQEGDLGAAFAQARNALGTTQFAHICLFDKKQIRTYLKKHNEAILKSSGGDLDGRKLFDRIKDIYDLEDLAQRPILLRLIVKTLPLFRKSSNGGYEIDLEGSVQQVPDITPSVLYSVYTEKELEREYKKGKVRWLIDRQEKVRTIAAIAYEMFKRDALTLDRTALAQVVDRSFPGSEIDQASYLTDIRTCSFLSRDNQDCVRFTHKSFMEYYAAVAIHMSMRSADEIQNILSTRRLTDEVAFFLGDAIAATPTSEATLNALRLVFTRLSGVARPSETCLENVINVLNYARQPISPLKEVKCGVLIYRKLSVKGHSWESLSIGILRLIKVRAASLSFARVESKQIEADSVSARLWLCSSSELRGLRFWSVLIEKCEISDSSIAFETWRDSHITTGSFRNVMFSDGGSSTQWLPSEALFEDCVFSGIDLKNCTAHTVRFVRCTFVMCMIDPNRWDWHQAEDCRGMLITGVGADEFQSRGGKLFACGQEFARVSRTRSSGGPRSWEELFVASFDSDPHRLPKNDNEIKARLRQVDLAFELNLRRGQIVSVVGSDFSQSDDCRIVACDHQAVKLFSLTRKTQFSENLRRISPDNETDWKRIRVERS